jgi:hypothetical protein
MVDGFARARELRAFIRRIAFRRRMTAIDPLTLAALAGTWILVVGTLVFAYWQIRQAGRLHSASTLLDLRERFYNDRMRQARQELSEWLLRGDRDAEIENWEVGIFFELMGFLTRSGVLDRRMVWSAFGSWISAYYTATTQPVDMIRRWRAESQDPTIFAEFEWLALQMRALDDQFLGATAARRNLLADAKEVLDNEVHLTAGAGRPR